MTFCVVCVLVDYIDLDNKLESLVMTQVNVNNISVYISH